MLFHLIEYKPFTYIENHIQNIRRKQVIVDRNSAELYCVESKVLRQAVKRNIRRFPDDFTLVLTLEETEYSRLQIVTLNDSQKQRGRSIGAIEKK